MTRGYKGHMTWLSSTTVPYLTVMAFTDVEIKRFFVSPSDIMGSQEIIFAIY